MFNVSHLNVRSLIPHFVDFRNYVLDTDCDVVGVTETWLNPEIDINLIHLEDYKFIRLDRPTRGGGVGMYIKEKFKYELILSECNENIEYLWIKLWVGNTTVAIGTLYRQPKSNYLQFLDEVENMFSNIFSNFDYLICVGDFNINMLDIDNSNTIRFCDILEAFNLTQIIKEPTRDSSLLDLIITNIDSNFCNDSVDHNLVADHSAINCKFNNFYIKPQEQIKITYRCLTKINYENFQRDLSSMPWHNIYTVNDIDEMVNLLNTYIMTVLELHAPKKTIIRKRIKYTPWITENIILMQKLRDKALQKFRRTQLPQHWSYYKQLRNFTNNAIKAEKRAYLNFKFQNCNIKEKWSELKKHI